MYLNRFLSTFNRRLSAFNLNESKQAYFECLKSLWLNYIYLVDCHILSPLKQILIYINQQLKRIITDQSKIIEAYNKLTNNPTVMPKTFHQVLPLLLALLITKTLSQQQLLQEQTKKQILTTVQYKYLIFTTHCYDSFFHHGDWLNFDCIKMTGTKVIGYSLVMGGAIIKFPQIIKVIGRKSVLGISFMSVILQLSSNILASGYCIYKGNPFSLYGENVFIGAQMLIIILLFVFFGTGNKLAYLVSFFALIAAAFFITDPANIPAFVVENSIILQSLLICTSRMSQIIEVFSLKSTGSLALVTWALSLLGNVGRIATIMVEASNDYKFLLSMVAVAVLNATIVFQFYWYRKSNPKSQLKND